MTYSGILTSSDMLPDTIQDLKQLKSARATQINTACCSELGLKRRVVVIGDWTLDYYRKYEEEGMRGNI